MKKKTEHFNFQFHNSVLKIMLHLYRIFFYVVRSFIWFSCFISYSVGIAIDLLLVFNFFSFQFRLNIQKAAHQLFNHSIEFTIRQFERSGVVGMLREIIYLVRTFKIHKRQQTIFGQWKCVAREWPIRWPSCTTCACFPFDGRHFYTLHWARISVSLFFS